MTFQELIRNVAWNPGWDRVWERMLEIYPDQYKLHDEYQKTFNRCRRSEPVATKMRILVRTVQPDEIDLKYDPDAKPYVVVDGKNGTRFCDEEDYRNMPWYEKATKEEREEEITYGIEFTPWNEWIGMEIDSESFKDFTEVEIAVHALWEMTFISYDENEIGDTIDDLREQVRRIDAGEEKLIPMEDVIKRIEEKFKKQEDENGMD